MATYTTNLNLIKPELTDLITESITNYNSNLDSLDTNINTLNITTTLLNSTTASHSNTINSLNSQMLTANTNITELWSHSKLINEYYFIWDYNNGSAKTYSIDIPWGVYIFVTEQMGGWAECLDMIVVTGWQTTRYHIAGADYFTVTNYSSDGTKRPFDITGVFPGRVNFIRIST